MGAESDLTVERDTSDLIIDITNVFTSGMSYDAIIMKVLEMISDVLHPERLLIFERGEKTTSCTFEWHAENVLSHIAGMQSIGNEQFDSMTRLAGDTAVLESDVGRVGTVDERMAERFSRNGVDNMMAVRLLYNGKAIGYLSANNYHAEKGIDAKRVLDAVAPFISTKIVNQRLVNQLERSSTHDSLTRLLNRGGFDSAIECQLAKHPGEPYVLVVIDIDDFKVVNDLYGHDVGDEALKSLARAITEAFPRNAIIGRTGGDEFLVMLFDIDPVEAGSQIEAFSSTPHSCELNGKQYPISTSVGYAEYPNQATNLQDAYAKADAALYAVKLAGKSGCKKYTPKHGSQFRARLGFTPRDIAENIPCAIVVCKASEVGEILYGNDELLKMFECRSFTEFMELSGGTFQGIIHPDDRAQALQELSRQYRDPAFVNRAYLDYRVITKTGAIKYIADNSRHVPFANVGEVAFVLLVDKGERERFKLL